MNVAGLLFLIFIGLPLLGFLLRTLVMVVVFPFFAIGAGAQAVKESRTNKRQAAIDAEQKHLERLKNARLIERGNV